MSVLSRHTGLPKYLNPVLRPLARWVPPLAVIGHQGRKSGTQFETPVQAFHTKTPTGRGYIVGLAYNTNANWALNLLANETGQIRRGGRTYSISNPRRRGTDAYADLPTPIRAMMRQLGIDEFIQFDATR